MPGRVRISDVASAAGVSIATVSASLNDVESARISADTRARVRAVADRLGYVPNRLAQGLRVQRSGTIGFVGDTVATTPYAVGMIQLAGEHAGEGVQRRLGDVVGRRSAVHAGQRPRLAGDVDDAPMAAGPQQRQEREAGLPGAEQVDLQRLPGNPEVGGAGALPGVVVDGGVVDQDVKAAPAAVEVGGDLGDGGRVGDIQPPGQDALGVGQGGGGPFGLGEVAGGEHDGVAPQRQLPGQFQADAAVGAGDKQDAGHRDSVSGVSAPSA
jgi:Bacterial regulatory proteins, lacI family